MEEHINFGCFHRNSVPATFFTLALLVAVLWSQHGLAAPMVRDDAYNISDLVDALNDKIQINSRIESGRVITRLENVGDKPYRCKIRQILGPQYKLSTRTVKPGDVKKVMMPITRLVFTDGYTRSYCREVN